jgi:RNase P subunit RPR2
MNWIWRLFCYHDFLYTGEYETKIICWKCDKVHRFKYGNPKFEKLKKELINYNYGK